MTVVGMAILIYRRRTTGPVFSATTRMDKVMYAFLAVVIVLGMWNTIAGSIMTIGGEYNYRQGVSVWFRSFLALNPDPDLMARAPLGFQLHALVAFALFNILAAVVESFVLLLAARLLQGVAAAGLAVSRPAPWPAPQRHRRTSAAGRRC
mgnify:CR=1 FL=1